MPRRMRLTSLVTTVAVVTASGGCAFHKQLPRPLTPEAVAKVQRALESHGAWIEYGAPGQPSLVGAVQRGNVRAAGPRPSLILQTDDPAYAVPLEDVRRIQVNDHLLGAGEGLLGGLLTGALVGAVLAPYARSTCSPSSDEHCIGLDFSDGVFMFSMLIGAVVGGAVGGAVGQRYVYTF